MFVVVFLYCIMLHFTSSDWVELESAAFPGKVVCNDYTIFHETGRIRITNAMNRRRQNRCIFDMTSIDTSRTPKVVSFETQTPRNGYIHHRFNEIWGTRVGGNARDKFIIHEQSVNGKKDPSAGGGSYIVLESYDKRGKYIRPAWGGQLYLRNVDSDSDNRGNLPEEFVFIMRHV